MHSVVILFLTLKRTTLTHFSHRVWFVKHRLYVKDGRSRWFWKAKPRFWLLRWPISVFITSSHVSHWYPSFQSLQSLVLKCSLFLDTPTCLLLLQVSEHGAYWLTSCDLAFLSFHSRVYPLTMMSRYRKLRWRQWKYLLRGFITWPH